MNFEFPADIPTELRDSFNSLNSVSPSSELLSTGNYRSVDPENITDILDRKGPLRYEIVYARLFHDAINPIRAIGLEFDGSMKFIPLSGNKFSKYGLFLRDIVQNHRSLIIDGVVRLHIFH